MPCEPAGKSALLPWSRRAQGLLVQCRLTPRASQDRLIGLVRLADGKPVIAVKVRAVPEHGKANLALLQLLARALALPASQLSLVGGASSRLKTIAIDGEPDRLATALDGILFPQP
jgi:uncharacterized protein YggU (UPF0235/DUF167 family)